MEKKIKYVFLSNGYKGGASTFIYDHICYLEALKKKIILIDDNPNNTYDKISKNVEVNKIKTNYFSLKSENRLSKILLTNNEKVYLFITNYAFLIKYYSLIDKFYKKKNKIILTIHSGILNLNIKNYFAGLIFSVIYKKIDYLRFGSHSAKLWWMQKYPWMKISNNKIFYNGVKINKKSKIRKINTNNINVSFVGRLEQEHNPKFFISIANECLKLNNKIKFNVFGEGSLFKSLKNNKKIIFHGWRNKEMIYRISDILIITSPINHFPYVALEAKNHGVPVISCSKGDIKKIIKNNSDGYIQYTKSTSNMIKLLNKSIKNYRNLSKNSLANIKNFDRNKLCQKFWRKIK